MRSRVTMDAFRTRDFNCVSLLTRVTRATLTDADRRLLGTCRRRRFFSSRLSPAGPHHMLLYYNYYTSNRSHNRFNSDTILRKSH